jgi:hypothetical protein
MIKSKPAQTLGQRVNEGREEPRIELLMYYKITKEITDVEVVVVYTRA